MEGGWEGGRLGGRLEDSEDERVRNALVIQLWIIVLCYNYFTPDTPPPPPSVTPPVSPPGCPPPPSTGTTLQTERLIFTVLCVHFIITLTR